MTAMKVGIQLPEVEREVRWPELRDIALTAEGVGFDSIWVGDHLLFRDDVTGSRGPWEAWSMLAALAEATERVELGPLVAATSFHSPPLLVKKAAAVDEISGGRLILGLGAGWNSVEYDAFGFPFDRRVSRFEEAFTIIRTLLREGAMEFDGHHYTLKGTEILPRPRPDIPLMIGSNGPRMLRIAVPHVDMWNAWYTWFGNTPEGLGPLVANLDEACADTDTDVSKIEKTVAVYVQIPGGRGRVSVSEDRSRPPITGSDEEIAIRLGEFEEAGVGHIQLVVDPIDAASVEKLGEVLRILR